MKKLLIKLLPRFVSRLLIFFKYKKENLEIHKKNILEGNMVSVKCTNPVEIKLLKEIYGKSFGHISKIDKYRLYFHPVAVIKIPNDINDYLRLIGAKPRNMNKKAIKEGVSCAVFEWNNYLDDVYKIHTSAEYRQGRKMDSSYQAYPERQETTPKRGLNIVFVGAFKEENLIAYVELYIFGNFATTNRILGHQDYLKLGTMNLLIKEAVRYAIENNIKFINYLTMQNRKNNSLSAFKKRVGFREYSLLDISK